MNQIKKIVTMIVLINSMSISCLFAGIGIDPVQVEIAVDKGIDSNGICKVFNTGDKPMQVTVRAEDWLKLGIDPNEWIKIEPTQFILEPGKAMEVKYTINTPIVSSGEFMAMLFFSGIKENNNIGTEFGIPVYATVKGTEVINAEILEINISYKEGKGVSGYINIKNNGNVHIRPYTSVNITNDKGDSAAYFGAQYGLPVQVGRERKYSFVKEDIKLAPGIYKVIAISEYGSLYKKEGKAEKETELLIKDNSENKESSQEGNIVESVVNESALAETK